MKIINKLLTRYIEFRKKLKFLAEESWKKYCLNNYGVYCNADKLTHEEMLQAFWKILENGSGYDVSNFTSNTSLEEPSSQKLDWDDFGDLEFIYLLEDIFGFARHEIFNKKPWCVNTFGELADLVIQRAKEKKQQQEVEIV